MNRIIKVFCYVPLVLSAIFLFSGCSSATEKPKVHTVVIEGMKFAPQEITVHKGDSIVWINRDVVDHDVTEETGKLWTSSLMHPGDSWKMEVTGNADYYCSIHVVMKGKVKVE